MEMEIAVMVVMVRWCGVVWYGMVWVLVVVMIT
jgi:hypothetical protein